MLWLAIYVVLVVVTSIMDLTMAVLFSTAVWIFWAASSNEGHAKRVKE
jgi:hypothetical protein